MNETRTDCKAPRLRVSMQVGALYDLLLGLSIVMILEPLSTILPIPYPAEPFYARVVGVLLVALAGFYAMTAAELDRHIRNVGAAVFARTFGGLYLLIYATLDASVSWFFIVFGTLDLIFALWHTILLHKEAGIPLLTLIWHGERRPGRD